MVIDLNTWESKFTKTQTKEELEEIRIYLLGKNGLITRQLKTLGSLTVEERKRKGQTLNHLRDHLQHLIEQQKEVLEKKEQDNRLIEEKVDIALPVYPQKIGGIHPISSVIEEICFYFENLGFFVKEGPDIEDEEYNFEALNIPPHHPARQSHDTFFFSDKKLLRTHTSPVQIRTMRSQKPPLRILAPGRVYRCDHDATHSPMFHQIEGFVVEKEIHMGHLKATIINFCRSFFKLSDLRVRFRPSFFPFTEPSAEVDIAWDKATGKIGKGFDFLEVLGCGMVHPQVLRNGGIDSSEYQGFAFGLGIERFAMLKLAIPDIRSFYEGDIRWLKHFNISPFSSLKG